MNKMNTIKKRFLENLTQCKGTITTACRMTNISRTAFYDYYNKDSEFRESVSEIKELSIDFVESKLMQKIDEGETTAIIFFLKTRGRKRGYAEKLTIEETMKSIHPSEIDYSKLAPETLLELATASEKISQILITPTKSKPEWLR